MVGIDTYSQLSSRLKDKSEMSFLSRLRAARASHFGARQRSFRDYLTPATGVSSSSPSTHEDVAWDRRVGDVSIA